MYHIMDQLLLVMYYVMVQLLQVMYYVMDQLLLIMYYVMDQLLLVMYYVMDQLLLVICSQVCEHLAHYCYLMVKLFKFVITRHCCGISAIPDRI